MRKVPTSRAPDCTVQKYIGSAYDHVKNVSEHIDEVIAVAGITDKIDTLHGISSEIKIVADNKDSVVLCANEMAAIKDAPHQAQLAIDAATEATKQQGIASAAAIVSTTQANKAEEHKDAAKSSEDEATIQADISTQKASESLASATSSKEYATKSLEIYEAFAKGAVYRGGWNPQLTPVYPSALGVNSYWDVYLNEGEIYFDWDGITWVSGDRLIFSVPDNKYFHISRAVGVTSVQGKAGNVLLVPSDIYAVGYDSPEGSARIPSGTTAERTVTPLGGEFRFNNESKEFEGYNESEWGSIGGGGVPEFIVKGESFTVEKKKAYRLLMMDGVSKTVNVPVLADKDWFALDLTQWERDTFGFFVTVNFGTDVISNGTDKSNTFTIDQPCTLYFQRIAGKWGIVDGIGIDGDYGALEKRVEKLEGRKSTCLINAANAGSGAPHETVITELPAKLTYNTRYVLPNPFGINTPVLVEVELFANNRWAKTGWIYSSASQAGFGAQGGYVQGEGVYVQTGGATTFSVSPSQGNGHGNTANISINTCPVRVFVRRMED